MNAAITYQWMVSEQHWEAPFVRLPATTDPAL
jgi:hypothetical protein